MVELTKNDDNVESGTVIASKEIVTAFRWKCPLCGKVLRGTSELHVKSAMKKHAIVHDAQEPKEYGVIESGPVDTRADNDPTPLA